MARRVNGIFLADFEQGEIGPDLFRHACLMGLEGLVSKQKTGLTVLAALRTGSRSRIEAGERHLVADKGLAAQVLNDRPIDLQTIQDAGAKWDEKSIEVTFSTSIGGNPAIFRSTMSVNQAARFAERLRSALSESAK